MSDYFMDYGPDWPPAPKEPAPAAPKRRRLRLWHKCAIALAGYAAITALGLIALHYHGEQTIRFNEPSPTSHSATTR